MKFSKELEERIDREIERIEKLKAEGKMRYYSEEEAMKMMFMKREDYAKNYNIDKI